MFKYHIIKKTQTVSRIIKSHFGRKRGYQFNMVYLALNKKTQVIPI